MPAKPRYKIPTEDRLTRAAVHYLERYATSKAHLQKVLERKVLKACMALDRDPADFATMIDSVVEKCVRAEMVNDQTYAETKVASLHRTGMSRRKIAAKLHAKGVDRDMVQSALSDLPEDEFETALVHARRKRLGPFRNTDTRDASRDKDMAALCRAGFSYQIARRVIDHEPAPAAEAFQL